MNNLARAAANSHGQAWASYEFSLMRSDAQERQEEILMESIDTDTDDFSWKLEKYASDEEKFELSKRMYAVWKLSGNRSKEAFDEASVGLAEYMDKLAQKWCEIEAQTVLN